jgi:hypothetical protein
MQRIQEQESPGTPCPEWGAFLCPNPACFTLLSVTASESGSALNALEAFTREFEGARNDRAGGGVL